MKQENKPPLYKVLNEQRTQGDWIAEEHDQSISEWYGNITALLGKDERGIMNIETISCQIKRNGIERAKANAQYTALAVNNLHILAEALDNLHKAAMQVGVTEWWQKHGETVAQAKEALNRIS